MKTQLYKSESRGNANHGWLKTNHSFSFANYYDRTRMHFGAIRVLNDDVIAAGKGFGKHPHDNMEIITIPLSGAVMHEDSMGHKQTISPNEVQHMSAGTGIFHSEYNASTDDELTLLQIWIMPKLLNIKPIYNQVEFDLTKASGKWQTIIDQEGTSGLKINQESKISRAFLKAGEHIEYTNSDFGWGNYIFLIEGEIEIGSETLNKRDALEITEVKSFEITAKKESYILNIETTNFH